LRALEQTERVCHTQDDAIDHVSDRLAAGHQEACRADAQGADLQHGQNRHQRSGQRQYREYQPLYQSGP